MGETTELATAKVEAAVNPDGLPFSQRVESGSVNVPIARFPRSSDVASADANEVASEWVKQFTDAIASKDASALEDLFLEQDSYWRDHLVLSWEFHTIKDAKNIANFAIACRDAGVSIEEVSLDKSSGLRSPVVANLDGPGASKGVQAFLAIATSVGHGRGVVRLTHQDGSWKAFTLFTSLETLNGNEESVYAKRPLGVQHGDVKDRKTWLERRIDDQKFTSTDPTVLIVGAGQGGLSVAARLKMLGIEALIIDQEQRIGDNWRTRYDHLVLHDPVWFDHMPYLRFPPNWPIFTPKDKLADFFESYVKLLELNVWVQTRVVNSYWDGNEGRWTVELEGAASRTIRPRHIIQATGHSGEKYFPSHIKGITNFSGRLVHSSDFPGANPDGNGKSAIVVGSCNSGHDIAQDFYEKGYNVTMVQRSSTCVVSSDAILKIALAPLYEENGPPVDDADLALMSMPTSVLKGIQCTVAEFEARHDEATLQGLEKAGFRCDRGPDDAGLLIKYFQRGGGYYIDVGTSQLIIDGKIKVKQGQEIEEILPHGVRFQDGSELPADEIVFATGYQNMRSTTRTIFGDKVADRVGDVWGFDQEGEMRTIWRKSGHPGFWFMGGNLALCRYFSLKLALQIIAIELGLSQLN